MADYYLSLAFDEESHDEEEYNFIARPFRPRNIVYSSNQAPKKKLFTPPDDDFCGYFGF